MANSKDIGIARGIFGPPRHSTAQEIVRICTLILPMTLSKNSLLTTESSRRVTKYLTLISKNIWTRTTETTNPKIRIAMTSSGMFCRRWKIWPLMPWKQPICTSHPKDMSITLNSSVLTSCLMKTWTFIWFKSIPTPAWKFLALSSVDCFPDWSKMSSSI